MRHSQRFIGLILGAAFQLQLMLPVAGALIRHCAGHREGPAVVRHAPHAPETGPTLDGTGHRSTVLEAAGDGTDWCAGCVEACGERFHCTAAPALAAAPAMRGPEALDRRGRSLPGRGIAPRSPSFKPPTPPPLVIT